MKDVQQQQQEHIDNAWVIQDKTIINYFLNTFIMTHKLKIKLLVFIGLILIGFCLPLLIKTVLIKRIFQFIILSISSLLLLSFIQEKKRKKETINYLGLILVTLYGIGLFLLLRKA